MFIKKIYLYPNISKKNNKQKTIKQTKNKEQNKTQ